jgi:hypothetical protein
MAGEETTIEIVFNLFPILTAGAVEKADRLCEHTADDILADAQQLIDTPPRSGLIYKRGSRTHQASAPGEPPITDYGHLASTGYTKKNGEADWEAGFSADYALKLEFGTPLGKIKPRPFLRPSVEKRRGEFIAGMTAIAKGA